ncbi:hypothetical protein PCANC_11031, partial [Puccinia coronata f. sp. avenae]
MVPLEIRKKERGGSELRFVLTEMEHAGRRTQSARALAYVSRSTLIRQLWYPYNGTGTLIRVPKYPYKGYRSTLIRVLHTLIRVPKYPYKGTSYPYRRAHVSLSIREAYVSQPRSVPLELTWARVPKPATNHTNPSAHTQQPLNGPTTA